MALRRLVIFLIPLRSAPLHSISFFHCEGAACVAFCIFTLDNQPNAAGFGNFSWPDYRENQPYSSFPLFHSHSTSSPSSKSVLSIRWYQPHNSFISLLLSLPFFCSYCLFLYLTIRPEFSLLLASSLLTRTVALPPLGSEEGWVWSSYVLCHVPTWLRFAQVEGIIYGNFSFVAALSNQLSPPRLETLEGPWWGRHWGPPAEVAQPPAEVALSKAMQPVAGGFLAFLQAWEHYVSFQRLYSVP